VAEIAAHLAFAVATVHLVSVDLREQRLPNRPVAWTSGAVFALLLLAAGLGDEWSRIGPAAGAAVGYGVVFLLLWLVAPHALGAGDVKLAPVIGLTAGWAGVWVAALWVPLLLAVLAGGAAIAARARGRTRLAFGPVMLAACWLALIFAGVGWVR
jgi:leader peptidase (prepilin peptidase)/N-methyltransferase